MEYVKTISEFGALLIMAGLFVWVFVQDKTRNNKLLENIAKSNDNIAAALELLKTSNDEILTKVDKIDEKSDRNYQEVLRKEKIHVQNRQ